MEIFSLFASSSIVFFLTWLGGCLFSIPLLGIQNLPPYVAFFIRLAIGYIAICTAWSLWFTGCYTIFTGVATLYAAVVFFRRKEFAIQPFASIMVEDWKYILTGFAILPIFLLLLHYRNGYFENEVVYGSYQDNGIYTNVAEYLKITGVEVSSPWYQMFDVSADGTAKVYHYGDLWFMAFTLGLSNASPLDVYNYVYTSVLALFCFFGNMAICISLHERCGDSRWLVPISFFLVLFNMTIPEMRWSNYFDVNAFAYPRIAALPILLSLAIVTRRYQVRHVDTLAFGALILADVIFMPTLFASAALVCICRLYQKRNRQNLTDLLCLFFSVGFFFFFYLGFGSLDNSSTTADPPGNRGYFYYFAKNITAAHLKHFIFFLPSYLSLLFLFFSRHELEKHIKDFFGMLLAILVFSSFFTALMNGNVEGFQFTGLVHTTVSAMLTIGCIVVLWHLPEIRRWRNHTKRVLVCLLFLQIIYGVFASTVFQHFRTFGVHTSFLNLVKPKIANLNKIGVAVSNPGKVTSYTVDPRICQYCNFLKQIEKGFWVNRIDIPEALENVPFKERTKAVELSPFYRFIQKLKAEGRYQNYEDAQMQFIENYNVEFVVVEKGAAVPQLIMDCVESSLTDSYSGTTILFLCGTCSKN